MAANRFRVRAAFVDGEQYPTAPVEWTYRPAFTNREPQVGPDGNVSFVETIEPAMIRGAWLDQSARTADEIKNASDVTVTLHGENGKTYVLRNATQVNGDPVNIGNGQIPVEYVGESGDELLA